MTFERTLMASWGDMDTNAHMRNSAFLDMCSDVRMMFFAEHGFAATDMHRQRLGPVVKNDDIEYFRELHLMDSVRVTLMRAGLSDDGSRFRVRNEFWRADGKLAARVTSTGGWLDLDGRKLIVPPELLRTALRMLDATTDYAVLPSSVK